MRLILLLLAPLLLAASPATDEADRLLDQGRAEAALKAVEAAADRGDVDSIAYLARFYDEGVAVARSLSRAAMLYRRAAEGGHAYAQWRLGVMLDLGEGVVEDADEALLWIRRAADQGLGIAHASLGVMYANGRGTPPDYAASMRAYRRAAEMGEAGGFYGIGVLYNNGQGVDPDPVEGLAWAIASAALGDERGRAAIERNELAADATRAAVDRANAILSEYGHEDHRIEFKDLGEERPPVAA